MAFIFYIVAGINVGAFPLVMKTPLPLHLCCQDFLALVAARLRESRASRAFSADYLSQDNLILHGPVPVGLVIQKQNNVFSGTLPAEVPGEKPLPKSSRSNPLLISLQDYPNVLPSRRSLAATNTTDGFGRERWNSEGGREMLDSGTVAVAVVGVKRTRVEPVPVNLQGHGVDERFASVVRKKLKEDVDFGGGYSRLFTVDVVHGDPRDYMVDHQAADTTASTGTAENPSATDAALFSESDALFTPATYGSTAPVTYNIPDRNNCKGVIVGEDRIYTFWNDDTRGAWDVDERVTIVAGKAVVGATIGMIIDLADPENEAKNTARYGFVELKVDQGYAMYAPETIPMYDCAGVFFPEENSWNVRKGWISTFSEKGSTSCGDHDTFFVTPAGSEGCLGGGVFVHDTGQLVGVVVKNEKKRGKKGLTVHAVAVETED